MSHAGETLRGRRLAGAPRRHRWKGCHARNECRCCHRRLPLRGSGSRRRRPNFQPRMDLRTPEDRPDTGTTLRNRLMGRGLAQPARRSPGTPTTLGTGRGVASVVSGCGEWWVSPIEDGRSVARALARWVSPPGEGAERAVLRSGAAIWDTHRFGHGGRRGPLEWWVSPIEAGRSGASGLASRVASWVSPR